MKKTPLKRKETAHVRLHGTHRSPPIVIKLRVDDCLVKMELDTGASMSIMSQTTFFGLWPGRSLEETDVRLQSYTKEPIPVVGCCYVNLGYKGQTVNNVPLLVVEGSGPSLLGRDWFTRIRLDWKQIYHLQSNGLQAVLDSHSEVFREGLGTMKGLQQTFTLTPKLYQVSVLLDSSHIMRYVRKLNRNSIDYSKRECLSQ